MDVKDIRRAGQVVSGTHTRARALIVLSTRASRRLPAHTRTRTHKWRQTTGPNNHWSQRDARQNRRDRTRPNSTGNLSTIPSCK